MASPRYSYYDRMDAVECDDGQVNYQPEDYDVGQLINQGCFAKIYAVRAVATKKECALKVACCENISLNQIGQFTDELLMLRKLQHPYIISPETSWTEGSQMAILMPLMPYRSCAELVQERFPTGISEYAMGLILSYVIPAVEYIHERKIIHRAIKGSHILINSSGVAVLSGFKFALDVTDGLETNYNADLSGMTKCLNWLSPEMIAQDGTGYTFNTDVYSLGITILEMCNGVVPFNEMSPAAMMVQKMKFVPPQLWDMKLLPSREGLPDEPGSSKQAQLPSEDSQEENMIATHSQASDRDEIYAKKCYSKDFQGFTNLCLLNDRSSRAEVAQLKKHKFMKSVSSQGPNNLIKVFELKDGIQFIPTAGGDVCRPWFSLGPEDSSDSSDEFDWDFGLE